MNGAMPDGAGSRRVSGHPPTAPASRPPVQSNARANASAVVIRPAPVGPTNAYACATRSVASRSEEHTSELQSQSNLVCRLLLEKKKERANADLERTPNETAK